MPRTKEQFEEMRKATKEKIQSAAMQLFAKKGLAATNVQEIAALAGISHGLLYRHYKTKEELFYELVEMALMGLKEVSQLLKTEASPKMLMERLAQEIYDDLANNNDFMNLMILLTQATLSGDDDKVSALVEQDYIMLNSMADLIKRGQELGEFGPGEPYGMATFFFSTIQGISIMKASLQARFKMPSRSLLTRFLYQEGDD